ncbi:MAG: bifunctional diguanylate cyclase/phosphodiesterase [Candidatus Eremiobacterota bacterium]
MTGDSETVLQQLDPLVVLDPAGLVLMANEPARSVLGEDVVGRHLDLGDGPILSLPGLGRAEVHRFSLMFRGELARMVLLHPLPEQRSRPGPRAAPEPGRRLVPFDSAMRALDPRGSPGTALLVVDLDRFNVINAVLGYRTGDELLRQVGQRLAGALRGTDLVCRRGEDEFLVVLSARTSEPGPEPDRRRNRDARLEAAAVAGRLLESLVPPFHVDGHEIFAGASIGIALVHPDVDPQMTLKGGESALYRAKELGRSRFEFFTGDLQKEKSERLVLEGRLRRALEREEFFLLYQPVVELSTGRLAGVEALIRWQSPDLGVVPPALFIPLAEESSLIVAIGDWVLREACRQACRWAERRSGIFTACNLSVVQFTHSDFLRRVESLVAEFQPPPGSLEMEITETAIMQATDTDAILSRLEELGLLVAIDDFGVGHSSLSRLKSLKSHLLKLDSSFVRGLPKDRKDASIASAVISMAGNLGMQSLAEGVETPDQWRFLLENGCTLGQGFLFSPPVPAEEVERWLESGHRWQLLPGT